MDSEKTRDWVCPNADEETDACAFRDGDSAIMADGDCFGCWQPMGDLSKLTREQFMALLGTYHAFPPSSANSGHQARW